jgi:hypothetical protein
VVPSRSPATEASNACVPVCVSGCDGCGCDPGEVVAEVGLFLLSIDGGRGFGVRCLVATLRTGTRGSLSVEAATIMECSTALFTCFPLESNEPG